MLGRMAVATVSMSAMHEEMHQRARQQHEIGQKLWNVHPVLHEKQHAGTYAQSIETHDQGLSRHGATGSFRYKVSEYSARAAAL